MKIIKRFVGPMIIGMVIGFICFKLGTISIGNYSFNFKWVIQLMYTFSTDYTQFLNFVAPILVFVFVAVGCNNILTDAKNFFLNFLKLLVSSNLVLGVLTFLVAIIVVPSLVSPTQIQEVESLEPFSQLVIGMTPLFNIFVALILGILVGLFNAPQTQTMKLVNEAEVWVTSFMSKIAIPLIPFWIMGTFARSSYMNQSTEIIKSDILLSLLILAIQFVWLFSMYFIGSIKSSYSFSKITKAGLKLYLEVVSLAGNGTGVIVPIAVDAQKEVGVNSNKAKIISASSFNMPGSLVSNIIFSYGILIMAGMQVDIGMYLMYIVALVITLVMAPSVPGGVFAVTQTLLTPMLGFSGAQIDLMGALYFKQGTPNAAVNNAADVYLGVILDNKK